MFRKIVCRTRTFNYRHLQVSAYCSDKGIPDDLYPSSAAKIKDPFKRTWKVFADELKDMSKGKFSRTEEELFPSHVDILIVGSGIIGSSIAFWLKHNFKADLRLCMIEKDPTYSRASTPLSVGGIRQQFSVKENIELSMFAAEFLRQIKSYLHIKGMSPPEIHYNPHGYLLLASESGANQLAENQKLQSELGASIELLDPNQLKTMFPWLNTDGIALGSYGLHSEGWFDPYQLLMALKNKSLSLGTRHLNAELIGCKLGKIRDLYMEEDGKKIPFESCHVAIVKTPDGIEREITFSLMVVASGYESGRISQMLNIGSGPGVLKTSLPVEPRKRYVYLYHSPDGPGLDCPFVIDPTGFYFRREGLGGYYICGRSPSEDEEPDVSNLDVDYEYFDKKIWSNLAHRVPAFESLKVKSGWAGYYDYNTFDQNAIIGNHPHHKNVIFATGFSGHGIQQSIGVGRAISELIIYGEYKTIDLSRFCFDRIIEDHPIYEQNII